MKNQSPPLHDQRLHALTLLLQVLPGSKPQRSLNQLLSDSEDERSQSQGPDSNHFTHPFTRVIVFGVCRYYLILKNILEQYLDKPLKNKDQDIFIILLIGAYQLLLTQKPQHAIVNSTTELAKKRGKRWATGLINALLRKIIREHDVLQHQFQQAQNAYPQWLKDTLASHYSSRELDEIYTHSLTPGPMTLRWNCRFQTQEAFLASLSEAHIHGHLADQPVGCFTLDQPVPVSKIPFFDQGSCSVQDEAAQWAAELLQPAPGQSVLDACSAPGGKCCHLLEKHPDISVTAIDISPERLTRVGDNLSRLNLNAALVCADASQPDSWCDGDQKFDHILLDAPCSGTGVIRRHPDILWLRRPEDIQSLNKLQLTLLSSLWSKLKQGGTLLYCTCSILPEENELLVRQFLKQQPNAQIDARPQTLLKNYGIVSDNLSLSTLGVQLLPKKNRHDGFYYALLRKH